LLLQIIEELRAAFPDLIKELPINYLWANKYDNDAISVSPEQSSAQHTGLAMHADDAVVNLNLWLTPDEANLNSKTGGLDIYKRVPSRAELNTFGQLGSKPGGQQDDGRVQGLTEGAELVRVRIRIMNFTCLGCKTCLPTPYYHILDQDLPTHSLLSHFRAQSPPWVGDTISASTVPSVVSASVYTHGCMPYSVCALLGV
jgi:hypothetical protein